MPKPGYKRTEMHREWDAWAPMIMDDLRSADRKLQLCHQSMQLVGISRKERDEFLRRELLAMIDQIVKEGEDMAGRPKKTTPPINRMDEQPDKLMITLISNTGLTDEQKQYIDGHRNLIERGQIKRSELCRRVGCSRLLLNHYLQQKAEWPPLNRNGGTPA